MLESEEWARAVSATKAKYLWSRGPARWTPDQDTEFVEDKLGFADAYFDAAVGHLVTSEQRLQGALERVAGCLGLPFRPGVGLVDEIGRLKAHVIGLGWLSDQRLLEALETCETALAQRDRFIPDSPHVGRHQVLWLAPIVYAADLLVQTTTGLEASLRGYCPDRLQKHSETNQLGACQEYSLVSDEQ